MRMKSIRGVLSGFRFILVSIIVALPIVLPVSAKGSDADVVAGVLREAIKAGDVARVKLLLSDNNLLTALKDYEPSPLYWVVDEKLDSRKLAKIMQLLLERLGEVGKDYGRYHLLTRAVHNHVHHVVDVLLRWPGTIKEVLAKYLTCDDVGHVPKDVTVVVSPHSRDCFYNFPRTVAYEQSQLAAVIRDLHRRRQKLEEALDPAAAKVDWKNPFLIPPEGMKPPMDQLVMNPRLFADFSEALVYYFLGEWMFPFGQLYYLFILLFALPVMYLMCVVM
uniref:Uncharacterized protein n=1 Tax=Trypanosoma congolense (strain IL3000) TaxID=1068625 RepID=G0UW59_TRYCI|nr:conserved hypothetical protein [Trypanosoma congolense IL3000]